MRITICAVGRGRNHCTAPIIADYIKRFETLGRGLGLTALAIKEVDAKGGNRDAESLLLLRALPKDTHLIVLDQRGTAMTSLEFAKKIQTLRADLIRDLTFVIGGAEGVSAEILTRADSQLSLGAMVFPHLLARLVLAEQLYRAASILANHPYHRE